MRASRPRRIASREREREIRPSRSPLHHTSQEHVARMEKACGVMMAPFTSERTLSSAAQSGARAPTTSCAVRLSLEIGTKRA